MHATSRRTTIPQLCPHTLARLLACPPRVLSAPPSRGNRTCPRRLPDLSPTTSSPHCHYHCHYSPTPPRAIVRTLAPLPAPHQIAHAHALAQPASQPASQPNSSPAAARVSPTLPSRRDQRTLGPSSRCTLLHAFSPRVVCIIRLLRPRICEDAATAHCTLHTLRCTLALDRPRDATHRESSHCRTSLPTFANPYKHCA